MKPKFHRVWFGTKKIPESYEGYWSAWRRQYPDYEFITWTDADIQKLELTKSILEEVTSVVVCADVARYEILYKFGGIYLDCDIRPHNHFSPEEMTEQFTVCNETLSTDYCSIGFIASPPGHKVFMDIIDVIKNSKIDESRPNFATGPWLFGRHIKNYPHRILPPQAFYPYLYDEPISSIIKKDLSNTYGIHVWGGSWLVPDQKREKAAQIFQKGDIQEVELILSNFQDQWVNGIKGTINVIRDIRNKCFELSKILSQSPCIGNHEKVVFEFTKVVNWLLEQSRDHMIWQIGAADGVLVDPLRALMINYDPPAILLEPNPYLFKMLQSSYRLNKSASLFQKAYGTSQSELILNAINPVKAAELKLPAWVMGISSVYCDKNAIGGLTIDEQTTEKINCCIERISVDVVDFNELLELSGGRRPDIFVVDTEGMDQVIIEDILLNKALPKVIHFEIQCMSQENYAALAEKLSTNYVLIEYGNDVTAYRKDVIIDYSKSIYINHGIATLFVSTYALIQGGPV